MRSVRVRLLLVALALAWVASSAAQQSDRPILILVSLDGWRWDYIDRADVPNLRRLAARGVRAEGLVPSFPSKTFPNHYTIVTGLHPDRHGIISNTMADPGFPQLFTMAAPTAKDPRWWGGEPLWVTAINQGRRASSMFWPGSEVAIRGVRPTDWRPFNSGLSNGARVDQVLEWLARPAEQRPSFVTLYFEEVDSAGHSYGPESKEVLEAARRVDDALGDLVTGVSARGLLASTTFVIVSDHGMAQLSNQRRIFLDDYVDLSKVEVVDLTPVLAAAPKAGSGLTVDGIYRALNGRHRALKIYKREEMPTELHYRENPRIQPIIGIADEGWSITSRSRLVDLLKNVRERGGDHGYDPRLKSMHALFVAAGPRVRQRVVVAPFSNVHLYEFMCQVLGLTPAQNDGDPRVGQSLLLN